MNDFCRMLESGIPRLRRYARALTRDASLADDLVQTFAIRGFLHGVRTDAAPFPFPKATRR